MQIKNIKLLIISSMVQKLYPLSTRQREMAETWPHFQLKVRDVIASLLLISWRFVMLFNFIIQILNKLYNQSMQGTEICPTPFPTSLCPNEKPTQFEDKSKSLKLKSLNFDVYFHKINTQLGPNSQGCDQLLKGNRQVKPKMINKLLSWLQKVSKDTMEFSTRTFETAARILVQFLSLFDEAVSNLQLLGCACLYLSSKISESTIVAAESYVACSAHSFTETDLMAKEAEVYKTLGTNTDFISLQDIYQFIRQSQQAQNITDSHHQIINQYISFCLKEAFFISQDPFELFSTIIHLVIELEFGFDGNEIRNRFSGVAPPGPKLYCSSFIDRKNIIRIELIMRFSRSQKVLKIGQKRALTFYKNVQLTTVKSQFRIKSNKKSIAVAKSPWSQTIAPNEIDSLLKRLNDTPISLYKAIENKNNKENIAPNTNKFKPLSTLSLKTEAKSQTSHIKTQSQTFRSNNKAINKQQEQMKSQKLLKKIEAAKKKYVMEYRKMLLGMKAINLDTDLPRIKYVEQNEISNRINLMHTGNKL